jgi:ariadne-1
VIYTSGGTKAIQCLCGFYFCFSCGEEAHTPAPCDLVKKWLLREKSDDATAIWLAAKTKECPKCGVRIEKNKACNHMTCIKCGHNFCWLCKGPWASHGNQTGGYYVCTKYDSDAKEGKVSQEERGMLDNQKLLQKYTYYYKRFKGSADAIKFTQKLGEKIEKNCRDEDLNKYSFLLEAVDKLIAARRILQWTYSLAYYLKNGGQKHLFEYQQEMLLNSTEALQDIMDNGDMDRLMALKKDIINKTSSIDKFRQEMVAQVERGEFDELLLSHADIGMDSWTCVNCKQDNKREQLHCQGCQSCKMHGEYECKACKQPAK